MTGGFLGRLGLVTAAALIVAVAWQSLPLVTARFLARDSEPRVVTPRGPLALGEEATVAVFEAARDSVVFISTEERVFDTWTRNAYEMPRGTGSGFFWDELGHVVTNAHVVAGASSATVRLADGTSYPAALVGVDPSHDLAVLRIGPQSLSRPLPIGSMDELRVGHTVLAIGNPFGLDWTLTKGIVSALERELPSADGRAITGLIQTDAAINPGNSGGPLLDSAGRLVGVNTAIYSPSGGSAGIGFAVPVDTVNRVVPQLIARGRYAPPTLGLRTDPRVDALARRAGLEGAVVVGVEPESPAAAAGIEPARLARDGAIAPRDIIVAIDGMSVENTGDLVAALDARSAGETVTLTIERGGRRREETVVLAGG